MRSCSETSWSPLLMELWSQDSATSRTSTQRLGHVTILQKCLGSLQPHTPPWVFLFHFIKNFFLFFFF